MRAIELANAKVVKQLYNLKHAPLGVICQILFHQKQFGRQFAKFPPNQSFPLYRICQLVIKTETYSSRTSPVIILFITVYLQCELAGLQVMLSSNDYNVSKNTFQYQLTNNAYYYRILSQSSSLLLYIQLEFSY